MRRGGSAGRCALAGLGLLAGEPGVPAGASDFALGDVFVAGASGKYQRYSSAGVFLEVLDNGDSFHGSGCAVDGALDLYTTAFDANRVVKFARAHPHPVLLDFPTDGVAGPADRLAESVVLDAGGNIYVGHAGGSGGSQVHRYDPASALAAEYAVAVERQGSDWIDLAADQCTLFYTSEGATIKQFDTCRNTQLPDFAALPAGPRLIAGALRVLPGEGECAGLLVAAYADIKRLDGAGAVVATYDAPGEDSWFAMNLAPDGESFWSAGETTNRLYRFHIATGAVEVGPIDTGGFVEGICVAGEPTAAACAATPEVVQELLAVRRAGDVLLRWRPASDVATDHYNVWKVVSGEKALIPVANGVTAGIDPRVAGACLAVPRPAPSCTDPAAVPAGPPLVFYQVRGACCSGAEGISHPF